MMQCPCLHSANGTVTVIGTTCWRRGGEKSSDYKGKIVKWCQKRASEIFILVVRCCISAYFYCIN